MAKLKIGILGAARGMDYFSEVLRNHPLANVTAVYEKYEKLREKAAGEFDRTP